MGPLGLACPSPGGEKHHRERGAYWSNSAALHFKANAVGCFG